MFITVLEFLMFKQIFLLARVKRSMLVIKWYVEVVLQVARQFKSKDLRQLEKIRKISKLDQYCLVLRPSTKLKIEYLY